MTINAADIIAVTKGVTKEWTKQRKAEDRGNRSRYSRDYVYSDRVCFTDCAHQILPGAYQHASGNGRYTVSKRQFYYACRDTFLEITGREIESDYFGKTLLVQYMNRHPETASWRVTADPRGTLTIPNAGHPVRVPCGTIAIERHLAAERLVRDPFDIDAQLRVEWPSLAAGQRYQAVLYIEKEGFEPQLEEARIGERFDLAIISCKGQSVVAARRYVDEVCRTLGGVPLFVVHDFDKAGFEISQRLTTVSEWAEENNRVTYRFKNAINVTDLGLRLEDVEKYGLGSERCEFKGYFADDSIATERERAFLQSGRRVELNAFTAPKFIEWLEGKLAEYLPHRLIPKDNVLEDAYRRAIALARLNSAIEKAREEAIEEARKAEIPEALRSQIEESLEDGDPDSPEAWDEVLYNLAKINLGLSSDPD